MNGCLNVMSIKTEPGLQANFLFLSDYYMINLKIELILFNKAMIIIISGVFANL